MIPLLRSIDPVFIRRVQLGDVPLMISGLESARRAEELDLAHERTVITALVSGALDLISVFCNLTAAAPAFRT